MYDEYIGKWEGRRPGVAIIKRQENQTALNYTEEMDRHRREEREYALQGLYGEKSKQEAEASLAEEEERLARKRRIKAREVGGTAL